VGLGTALGGVHGQRRAEKVRGTELDEERARQDALERQIEQELRRQEEVLDDLRQQGSADDTIRAEQERRLDVEPTDELGAPRRPFERNIPDSLYDQDRRRVGRAEKLVKILDADRDGRPEIEIVLDNASGERESRSEDTDYDGKLDTQNVYEDDRIVLRTEDTNHDGRVDLRIAYGPDEVATKKIVDTNYDGKDDALFSYEDGTLAHEERDLDNDGQIDRRVEYERRSRMRDLDDTDRNGTWDVWTYYDVSAKPSRIEKDTNADGAVDVWEYHEGPDAAQMQIVKRDEDLDKDGSIDISSYYEKGKLTRKEVLNPDAIR
jgi:antitoxin component YwqK of YwqJK toxin-antitoxin module